MGRAVIPWASAGSEAAVGEASLRLP